MSDIQYKAMISVYFQLAKDYGRIGDPDKFAKICASAIELGKENGYPPKNISSIMMLGYMKGYNESGLS